MLLFLAISVAYSAVDPVCLSVADTNGDGSPGPAPEGYSEAGQQDFLLNFFSAATTMSPLHAPIPNPEGRGNIGVELAVIPPLSCERRLVLNYTKTEDTNKVPLLPRPRMSFSFPAIHTKKAKIIPYGGFGYVPPLKIMETQNVIVSVEAGVGIADKQEKGFQYGLRGHATLMKSIAEIATPFTEDGETLPDFYMGSTFGFDAMLGFRKQTITPYLAVGFTDVSTFFYIDDDGVVVNNQDPYAGPVLSLGAQWRANKKLQTAAEFYSAPGLINTIRFRGSYMF